MSLLLLFLGQEDVPPVDDPAVRAVASDAPYTTATASDSEV